MSKLYEVNKSGRLIIHSEREKEYARELLKELEELKSREKALLSKEKYYVSMMDNINDEYNTMKLSKKEAEVIIKTKYNKELSDVRKFEDRVNELRDQMNSIETLLGR